jgi:CHAT domain-containing protein
MKLLFLLLISCLYYTGAFAQTIPVNPNKEENEMRKKFTLPYFWGAFVLNGK